MEDAVMMIGLLQAALLATLSYQAKQLQALTLKIGELCGQLTEKK